MCIYTVSQKTAPYCFCNNLVECQPISIIFLVHSDTWINFLQYEIHTAHSAYACSYTTVAKTNWTSDVGGKWPLKWKFSEMEMSFRIPRRDTEIRFVTKFGGNRPLRRCRKVIWFITQKNSGSAGLVPAPILPKMGRSRPKSPKTLNLVRIGCVLPDLFLKDWFFGPKSHYNIGIQPTIRKMRYENKLSAASNSQMSDYIGDPRSSLWNNSSWFSDNWLATMLTKCCVKFIVI